MPPSGSGLFAGPRRGRPSGQDSSSRTASHSGENGHNRRPDASPQLPPYEPPSQPLNDAGKIALAQLTRTSTTSRIYKQHLEQSALALSNAVGAITDSVMARRAQLEKLAEKRRGRGIEEPTENEIREAAELAELEREVVKLTEEAEAALRDVIDKKAELQDEADILKAVRDGVNRQKPRPEKRPAKTKSKQRGVKRRLSDSGDEDEEIDPPEDAGGDNEMPDADVEPDPGPIEGLPSLLQEARQAQRDNYDALPVLERYAKNNDYATFKKTLHDAIHPEDQVPLAHAKEWFDAEGRPILDTVTLPAAGAGGQADDEADAEEDDDLMIQGEVIDYRCPLTLKEFEEPYSNHKCKHTFEKSAILTFLRGAAQKICPVCPTPLSLEDFYVDPVFLRRQKRAALRRAREEAEGSDMEVDIDEDAAGDDKDEIAITQVIKGERDDGVKRERQAP